MSLRRGIQTSKACLGSGSGRPVVLDRSPWRGSRLVGNRRCSQGLDGGGEGSIGARSRSDLHPIRVRSEPLDRKRSSSTDALLLHVRDDDKSFAISIWQRGGKFFSLPTRRNSSLGMAMIGRPHSSAAIRCKRRVQRLHSILAACPCAIASRSAQSYDWCALGRRRTGPTLPKRVSDHFGRNAATQQGKSVGRMGGAATRLRRWLAALPVQQCALPSILALRAWRQAASKQVQ